MKKLLKILLNRRFLVIILLLIQILLIVWLILIQSAQWVITALELLSLIIILYVINRRDKSAYKIAWIILMFTLPVFGGLLYLILTWQAQSGIVRRMTDMSNDGVRKYIPINKETETEFGHLCFSRMSQVRYLCDTAGFPIYKNSRVRYFPTGESFFESLLEELSRAEKFIFLEYFIINADDSMWLDILAILKNKVSRGVEVRVVYDDLGVVGTMPADYHKELEKLGIKCVVFNPFRPFLSSVQNNRDHRKIAVIDGRIAYTGGINLADEYINKKLRFGHWQDSAISVEGEGVWSFTVMFLQLWNGGKLDRENFTAYYRKTDLDRYRDGYVIPYADTPIDDENVCEHVYMQIINKATDYVYIQTPYFIIDDSMMSAFILAAKSGVDIRIITPAVPDKKTVHMTTRSYYRPLIEAGVRIYEYTPGFIHSKVVVSDDDTATVGTANFDFRSLYLHYECGALIFNSSAVADIKRSFISLLEDCREIGKADTERNIFIRLWQSILRIIAPLL